MVEREKFDHIEERAIEGGRDYAFTDMAELCLVPDIVIPLKFKVLDFDKYKVTTCPSKTSLEEMHQQFFIFLVCPYFPAIHLQVILGASSPLVLIKV